MKDIITRLYLIRNELGDELIAEFEDGSWAGGFVVGPDPIVGVGDTYNKFRKFVDVTYGGADKSNFKFERPLEPIVLYWD